MIPCFLKLKFAAVAAFWLAVCLFASVGAAAADGAADNNVDNAVLKPRAESVAIFTTYFDGELDEDPSSGYNKLLSYIFDGAPSEWKQYRSAVLRTFRDFRVTPRSCIFPTVEGIVEALGPDFTRADFTFGAPVDFVSSHIMTKSINPIIIAPPAMKGKTIAMRSGFNTPSILRLLGDAPMLLTPSQVNALKLLEVGRVDMIYAWEPNVQFLTAKYGLTLPHYNKKLVIESGWTRFGCRNFDGAEAVIAWTNAKINRLKTEGRLQDVLGKFRRATK